MFPVLLAEEDWSIKRGQPSITRDLPKSVKLAYSLFKGWIAISTGEVIIQQVSIF